MSKSTDSKEFFEIYKTPQKKAETTESRDAGIHAEPVEKPVEKDVQPATVREERPFQKPGAVNPLDWIRNTATGTASAKETPAPQPQPQPRPAPYNQERSFRKDEVRVRQETLIIGAIAATFLAVACFFVGHRIGYNKGKSGPAEEWQETIESHGSGSSGFGHTKSAEHAQKSADTSKDLIAKTDKEQPKRTIKDKWTLRVVSYKNTKEYIEKAKVAAKTIKVELGYDPFIVNTGKDISVCIGEFDSNDNENLIKIQKALADFKYENKKQFAGCYPVRIK
jgi:hypothetical protein